jgi:hypothetical protein
MRQRLQHVNGVVSLHEEAASHATDTRSAVDSPGGEMRGGEGGARFSRGDLVLDCERRKGVASLGVRRCRLRFQDDGPMRGCRW